MAMGAQVKLHEREKKVLKLEETCLRSLIFQYQSALNALKVEELTLTNRLGQSLDRVRQSQVKSPAAAYGNISAISKIPTQVSKINMSDNLRKPSAMSGSESQINKRRLNLDASPFVKGNRFFLDGETNFGEDDEADEMQL